MEESLNKWLKLKKDKVNQLLDQSYNQYSGVERQNFQLASLSYRQYLSQSEQGREIIQVMKAVSKKIKEHYTFQLIVCDHYKDYLTKIDTIRQVPNFLFEHDWESAQNGLEDPIFIVAHKDFVEVYSIEETGDLLNIESRIKNESFI